MQQQELLSRITNLESCWAPVDKLNVFLHLYPSNGGVHVLMDWTILITHLLMEEKTLNSETSKKNQVTWLILNVNISSWSLEQQCHLTDQSPLGQHLLCRASTLTYTFLWWKQIMINSNWVLPFLGSHLTIWFSASKQALWKRARKIILL